MAWVHESDYHSRESQDMAYLAHIIESLYALLPAIRDLRKATLLREECFLQDVQLLHENHGHINDRPCKAPVRDENEHLATTTLAPATTDTPTYGSLGISHLINSLLEYAVSLWKEANYHAEEYQEVQISVSMFPTPQFSMGRLTYKDYAHTKARLRSPQFDVGQKARRQDRAADKTSGAQSLPVDASLIQLSQSKLERCEHALREDTKRRNAALGAGAAGLVLARMLLTRRARLRF